MKSSILIGILAWLMATPAISRQKPHVSGYESHTGIKKWRDIRSFTADIRKATRIYQDTNSAMAAGYQRFGPDMPNLGYHWINPRLIVDTLIDPMRPEVLTYLNVNGQLILTGVAFAYAFTPGKNPPKLPFKEMEWHYYSGNIREAAYGIQHKYSPYEKRKMVRLAMVHVWAWTDNPNGLFGSDNWALSYMRLGLKYPDKPDAAASKALFLAEGGIDYYLKFVQLCVHPDDEVLNRVRAVFSRYSRDAKQVSRMMVANKTITQNDQEQLASVWDRMWRDVKKELGESDWKQIASNLE